MHIKKNLRHSQTLGMLVRFGNPIHIPCCTSTCYYSAGHVKMWWFIRDLFNAVLLLSVKPVSWLMSVFPSSLEVWRGEHEPCAAMDGQNSDPSGCCHSWHWHWKRRLFSWTGENILTIILCVFLIHRSLFWSFLKGHFTNITTRSLKHCNICGLFRLMKILLLDAHFILCLESNNSNTFHLHCILKECIKSLEEPGVWGRSLEARGAS